MVYRNTLIARIAASILAIVFSVATIFAVGTPVQAAQELPSTTVAANERDPNAGQVTFAHNYWASEMNVVVATKRNGGGTQKLVRPGHHSGADTDSVYIYWVGQKIPGTNTRCYTYLNGTNRSPQGWVNTAWWWNINVDIRCR